MREFWPRAARLQFLKKWQEFRPSCKKKKKKKKIQIIQFFRLAAAF